MAYNERITDPEEIPVQVNFKIPFWLREVMVEAAHNRETSQAALMRKALETELASEMRDRTQDRTREMGATR